MSHRHPIPARRRSPAIVAATAALCLGALAHAQEGAAEAIPAPTPDPAALEDTPGPARAVSAAFLANPGDAPGDAAEPAPRRPVDEIVITSTPLAPYTVQRTRVGSKTDTPTFEQPRAVSAVPQSVMEDQASKDLWDALRNVSGVAVENVGGYAGPNDTQFLRGFRSSAQYYNGVLVEAIPSVNLPTLDRVEYLKGPASVLYGLIEPGGVINLVSRQPVAVPHYQLRTRFGSHAFSETSFDIGGPILAGDGDGDGALLYRVTGGYRHNESFRDHVTDTRYWITPSLAWTPIEGTRVSVELSHSVQHRPIDEGVSFNAMKAPVADISTFLGERGLPGQEYAHTMLLARVEQDLGAHFTLRSSFLGRHWENYMNGIRRSRPVANEDNTVVRLFEDSDFEMDSYNWLNELIARATLGPTAHTFLIGVDWRSRTSDLQVRRGATPPIDIVDPIYGAPDPTEITVNPTTQRMSWIAAYAQEQMAVFDDLHLTVGGRYDSVTQDSENVDDPTSKQEKDEGALTGQAGLLYALPAFGDNRVAVFADFSQSFLPTAPAQLDRNGAQLDPETGVQYEGGLKFDLLGSALQSTITYYQLTKENIPIADPEVDGAVQNAGRLGIHGVEVDIAGSPLPGLDLIASYTWADSEVLESDALTKGDRFRNQAEHTYSLWARYSVQSGALRGFGVGAGVFGMTDRPGDDQNEFDLDGYTRFDGALYHVTTLDAGPVLRTQLNVRNLADTEYYESSLASTRVFPGAPRSFDLTLAVAF